MMAVASGEPAKSTAALMHRSKAASAHMLTLGKTRWTSSHDLEESRRVDALRSSSQGLPHGTGR